MLRILKNSVMGLGLAALAFALASCTSSGGNDSSATAPPATAVTLTGTSTGKNTASAPAGKFTVAGARQPMVFSYTQFALYCVTFTNPPQAGSGTFDATGNFSVTVSDAGGVPVGCFIVDTTNQNHTVATLTFTIGSAGGMDSGTTTGAVFTAGVYTVDIQFDVGTGLATATVMSGGTPTKGGSATLAAADLAGSWQMYCDLGNSLPDLAACGRRLGGSPGGTPSGLSIPELFLDPITATDSVKGQLYALGAWSSMQDFTDAGSTEGMAMTTALATLTTPITSVLGPSTPGWMATAPLPMQKFNGFTGATFGKYAYDSNTMAAADVWTFLKTLTVTEINSGWVNPACFGGTPAVTGWTASAWGSSAWPGSPSAAAKACLLQAISVAAEKDRNNGLTGGRKYIPRPLGINWTDFASGSATTLKFDSSQIAGSPNVSPRLALMSLEFAGNSAMASETGTDSWTRQYWNGISDVFDACTQVRYTNVNLVNTGPGTFDAYFSTGESQTCTLSTSSNSTSNNTFKVKMVRPGVTLPFGTLADLTTTGTGGLKPLDGTWIRCRTGTPEIANSFSITGATVVYAQTAHSSTDGKCGNGELGQLQVVVVGTLTHDSTPTQSFTWTDGSPTPPTPPLKNGGGAITLTASRILATVTASYTSDAILNPVPGPTQTHGLLFFLDDTTGGGNPPKLYSDSQSPGTTCAGSGGYAACLDIAPMLPRN